MLPSRSLSGNLCAESQGIFPQRYLPLHVPLILCYAYRVTVTNSSAYQWANTSTCVNRCTASPPTLVYRPQVTSPRMKIHVPCHVTCTRYTSPKRCTAVTFIPHAYNSLQVGRYG